MTIIIDNVACKIITGGTDNLLSFNIVKELKEYLKVRPDGYQHTHAYKSGKWDGWKYFITPAGTFATGYLPLVVKHLKHLAGDEVDKLHIKIQDNRQNLPKFLPDLMDVLPNGYELTGKFSHQLALVQKVNNEIEIAGQKIYYPRGIIDAATNAGKNSICASLYMSVEKPRCLFLIHSQDIFKQAVDFFSSCFPVTCINSKEMEFSNFTIAMNKTLLNRAKESVNVKLELAKFNMLIVDECHKSSGGTHQLLQMVNAGMRVFVSGTPLESESKVKNMIVVGLSGQVLGKISNKELIEKGVSLRPIVKMMLNDTKGKYLMSYEEEEKTIIQNSVNQANRISDLIISLDGSAGVVSYIDIAHGEFMYNNLKANPNFKGVAEIVHGKDKYRSDKIEAFKKGKIDVLFSSMILKEGLNIPNIEWLIRAEGGKAPITTKQFVGRVIRDDHKNTTVTIYDFYHGPDSKYTSAHSKLRVKTYKKEEFEIQYEDKLRPYFKF